MIIRCPLTIQQTHNVTETTRNNKKKNKKKTCKEKQNPV